jgi:hypothetical protein
MIAMETRRGDEKRSRWPARIVGFLLLAEALLAGAIGVRQGLRISWREQLDNVLATNLGDAVAASGTFVIVAVLAFVAALGVLLLRRSAWLLGMAVQLLALIGTITHHFRNGPSVQDALMAFAVILVLYLNSRIVRTAMDKSGAEPMVGHGR